MAGYPVSKNGYARKKQVKHLTCPEYFPAIQVSVTQQFSEPA